MGLRDAISNSPAVGGAVAGVLIVAAGWIVVSQSQPRQAVRPAGQWFYRLDTGDLFIAPLEAVPPMDAPGGGVAVRARVYGCGSCDEKDRKTAILEKYPADVAAQLAAPLPEASDPDRAAEARANRDSLAVTKLLIALAPSQPGGDIAWTPQDSPGAMPVMEAADELCGSREPKICLPQ